MAVPWASLLASTPTAGDIVPAMQPGAFSSGLRSGLAFRQQRESEKARNEAQRRADATKKAFSDTMAVLQQNDQIPLPQAVAAGLKDNPDAIPEVLVKTINDLMPQMTPYQQATTQESKRYHDAMIGRYDEDRQERQRQFDIEQKQKSGKTLSDTLDMIENTWQDVGARKWVKSAKELATKENVDLRDAMRRTIPDDLTIGTIKKVNDAVSPILETRTGTQARGMSVTEKLKVQEELHGDGVQGGKRGLYEQLELSKDEAKSERIRKRIAELEGLLSADGGAAPTPQSDPAAPTGGTFESEFLKAFQDWKSSK